MASCKHIRSLLNGARGRGISTVAASDDVLAAIEAHVNQTGKLLLPILAKSLRAEQELRQEKLKYQIKLLRKDLEHQKAMRADLQQLLQKETELRAKTFIDLLRARGLNDTRGLFEVIQDHLAKTSQIALWLKGADAWAAILKVNVGLATCIKKCTKVPSRNVAKQAQYCYNVYSTLSEHVHAGKSLAELEVAKGGAVMFERGPLSPEQVQIFLCMGAAATMDIQEDRTSGTR